MTKPFPLAVAEEGRQLEQRQKNNERGRGSSGERAKGVYF